MIGRSLLMIFMVGLLLAATGCVKVHDPYGDVLDVVSGEMGLVAVQAVSEVVERTLVAQVKGSIYESGEIVSVFGSCLDAYDRPFLNESNASIINATFSAWYPNGTQFIDETNVTELDAQGHYLYTAPMAVVEGTYLTRLKCSLEDQFALAFGEWQNPRWVGTINETINQINATYALVNETFINLSEQITIVGQIANNTVDRNDSLLYEMILNLTINGIPSTGPGGALNWTEEYSPIIYFGEWNINVTASLGTEQVGNEYVNCFINTTNAPSSTNEMMEPIVGTSGPVFTYTEIIKKRFQFDWDVWCVEI